MNVPDLIAVLCGFREERPHERLIALMSLSAWLYWPNGPIMISEARAAAGALIIRNLLSEKLAPVKSVELDIAEILQSYL